jgi:predicted RNA binding protein YcfA (HicA-like mRNA interferase family)
MGLAADLCVRFFRGVALVWAHYNAHIREGVVAGIETNTRKIVARLKREGWQSSGGGKHEKFEHPDHPYPIIVPRHKELSPGVARSIARQAGWQ